MPTSTAPTWRHERELDYPIIRDVVGYYRPERLVQAGSHRSWKVIGDGRVGIRLDGFNEVGAEFTERRRQQFVDQHHELLDILQLGWAWQQALVEVGDSRILPEIGCHRRNDKRLKRVAATSGLKDGDGYLDEVIVVVTHVGEGCMDHDEPINIPQADGLSIENIPLAEFVWPICMLMALVSTGEAAKRLKVSTRRIRALIAASILPATKVGRDWVVEESELAALAKKSRPRGRPPKKQS